MVKPRNLGAVLALGALAVLPACSMFGGDSSDRSGQYSQSNAATPPASYGMASASTGTSGTVAPVSPDMIRKVQTTLQQNNDYRGQVDGVWGPMTESGVRTWQQAHNLNNSGEIDMATLQSMNISAGNQADNQAGQTNGTSDSAATQPTGNQNYSTGPNRPSGSNYSNNNSQIPANTPDPSNQGTPNANNNTATGSPAPNANGSNPSH